VVVRSVVAVLDVVAVLVIILVAHCANGVVTGVGCSIYVGCAIVASRSPRHRDNIGPQKEKALSIATYLFDIMRDIA
jgi:hypothetical protein